MSYSFQAKGTTKAEAIADVIAKMDQVVVQQPIHAIASFRKNRPHKLPLQGDSNDNG